MGNCWVNDGVPVIFFDFFFNSMTATIDGTEVNRVYIHILYVHVIQTQRFTLHESYISTCHEYDESPVFLPGLQQSLN